MIPADGDVDTVKSIAQRFAVDEDTVRGWVVQPGFPPHVGSERKRLFAASKVDAWVLEHRPLDYAAATGEPYTSGGDPNDLLDPDDFAVARAARLGRPAVSAATISGYVTRALLPAPDRRPGDGKKPPVARNSWYRRTVDAHLAQMRGRGNRSGEARKRSSDPAAATAPEISQN